MELTLSQLAERLGAGLVGCSDEGRSCISAVGPIETAQGHEVTFVAEDKYVAAALKSAAGAVIVANRIEGLAKPQLLVKDVNAALIQALSIFAPRLKPPQEGIDPTAKLGRDVRIGKGASIGPHVVIDDNVLIGNDTAIAGGCRIGESSKLGDNCRLDSNVVVYHNCILGSNVVVQANTTIGSVGFGYCFIDGAHKLIPHNGGVIVEDFVEIGANCCIDRAKFGNTIIGAGTKIDNLVQIAHNVVIGRGCRLSAQVGIAGGCKVGDGVVLAGQVGLADNIEVGAGVMIGAQAGVMKDVPPNRKLAWTPALDVKEVMHIVAHLLRLPKLAEQFKQLVKRVDRLEAADDHKR